MDPRGRTGCENIVLQLSIKFIKNDGELPFSMVFIDLHPTMIDISTYQNRNSHSNSRNEK